METLQDLVKGMQHKDGNAISWNEKDATRSMTYHELHDNIHAFSSGLSALQMQPGDKVSVFSRNLPEWIMVSLGINNAGMIDVPRGEDNSVEDLAYIIDHSGSKMIIVDDEKTLKKVTGKIDSSRIFTIKDVPGAQNISKILAAGRMQPVAPQASPDQTASIIYTSGTTGNPKGVELTHGNFSSNIEAVMKRLPITKEDKNMSVLPAWHVFERIAKYVFLEIGSETFYSSMPSLLKDLEKQRPTVLASVPRIWEFVYAGIIKKVKEQGKFKNFMFDKMYPMAVKYKDNGGLLNKLAYNSLDKSVFSQLRKTLGGNLRFAISGGSGLPRHIEDFFRTAQVHILEGYGMTETSPVIAARSFFHDERYSVGKPLENLQIRISDEGVLYVKGPSVMKGYYRNPEETAQVLSSDGWLNTGDLAHLDNKGILAITGRAKDLIKLSNGEYVNPGNIESALKVSTYIDTVVVVGNDTKNVAALIVPNVDTIGNYCQQNGIEFNKKESDTVKAALKNPKVTALFDAELKKYSNTAAGFKNYEIVRDYALLSKPFEVGVELTASLKVKRRVVAQMYEKEIAGLLQK
jgi:long-chain acyl-CoA synthetase